MAKGRPDYLSYLLCLWRVSGDGEPLGMGRKAIWRASLESTRTGERRGFASLDELFDFLREQTGEQVEKMVKEQLGYTYRTCCASGGRAAASREPSGGPRSRARALVS